LSQSTWQSVTTDEAIAVAIRNGRAKMPGFALEDEVIDELVQLIRRMGGSSNAPQAPRSMPSARAGTAQ
jgi:hypothetical protein